MLALHSSLMVSYVRARAESEGLECTVGVAERAERLIILIGGSLAGYFLGLWYMNAAMIILVIAGYFTVIQRMMYVRRQMKT